MIDSITTIGDASDINCWSGIPYHFSLAARSAGWSVEPWRLKMAEMRWPRRLWNLKQVILGRGKGGFQYSKSFANQALSSIEPRLLAGRVLSFNQHFPTASSVASQGGRLLLYLDATFPLLFTRYGIGRDFPKAVLQECLARERETFRQAEWLVFFQRWSAESAIRDCGADPAKVRVICPGANLRLPDNWSLADEVERSNVERPLVLGFIGKDWKRKGLPFLLEVRRNLISMGIPTIVRCAGQIPSGLSADSGVEYWGFINKHTEASRFLQFLRGCDIGCLFSQAEASSIAVLEFLRAGIPVAGFVVDGMVDLFPPDAGLRFEPGTRAEVVALKLGASFLNDLERNNLRKSALAWSPLVTWERCVEEWKELLTLGAVRSPVQLWRGL